MRPFARILALAGVILLGIAAVVPINTLTDLACQEPGAEVLLDPTCFEDDVQDGFLASYFGIILVSLALIGVAPAIGGRPAVLWVYSLTALGLAMVLLLFIDARTNIYNASFDTDLQPAADFEWGVGVLLGGVTLLLLATIVASFNAARQSATS